MILHSSACGDANTVTSESNSDGQSNPREKIVVTLRMVFLERMLVLFLSVSVVLNAIRVCDKTHVYILLIRRHSCRALVDVAYTHATFSEHTDHHLR